mmetsp:Transcript_21979/g.50108  ORF Transcript_21979/g.50108 Transcript_21979/m.50108 type:complete len:255 (-) Transcript_21979:1506-2270(-)
MGPSLSSFKTLPPISEMATILLFITVGDQVDREAVRFCSTLARCVFTLPSSSRREVSGEAAEKGVAEIALVAMGVKKLAVFSSAEDMGDAISRLVISSGDAFPPATLLLIITFSRFWIASFSSPSSSISLEPSEQESLLSFPRNLEMIPCFLTPSFTSVAAAAATAEVCFSKRICWSSFLRLSISSRYRCNMALSSVTSVTTALCLIFFALEANFRVLCVSSKAFSAILTVHISDTCAFPPRLDCSILVSLLSL